MHDAYDMWKVRCMVAWCSLFYFYDLWTELVIWELTIVKNKEGNETNRQQGPTASEVRFNQISQIFNGEKKKMGTGY